MRNFEHTGIITQVVKKRLSEYLEFDIQRIFDVTDYAYPFGGCIRDSIVGDPINDVDIICLKDSRDEILEILLSENWEDIDEDIHEYRGLRTVFTITRLKKNDKSIDLILPKSYGQAQTFNSFFNLLCNVDISNCGLYYNGHEVKESCDFALDSIFYKMFYINKDAMMYQKERTDERCEKFIERGWSVTELYEMRNFLNYTMHQDKFGHYRGKIRTKFAAKEEILNYLYRECGIELILED